MVLRVSNNEAHVIQTILDCKCGVGGNLFNFKHISMIEMGVDEAQYALPAELDNYMQESIFHLLGFCSSEEHLKRELLKAEESHRDLTLQLQQMQACLRELEHKRSKSKEEAVLNAQALKRQVAEGQKLVEQIRVLKDECNRLQQECVLYHNDRDVFMEAAYEAEDRAAEAEDRAAEAEQKNRTLSEELDEVKQLLSVDNYDELETSYTETVASLNSRIIELERYNASLEEDVLLLRAERERISDAGVSSLSSPEESSLQVLLRAAEEQNIEMSRKLIESQEAHAKEIVLRQDELVVHKMVSSAITAGVCRSLEEDQEASLRAVNLEFSAICRCMESELGSTRERVEFAEMNVQTLLLEVQALRDEACLCRGNLDKAEVEVQMLADENKELRILLKRRYAGSDSPIRCKGNKGDRSNSGGRLRSKTYEGHGDDSICFLCNSRQPLMPLTSNLVERKIRRQNLTVDGNFRSRSPSSPSMDLSPASIFQD